MKKYKLHLRYLYTFYSFDEILDDEAIDEKHDIADSPIRITLHLQEDSSFIVSTVKEDHLGKYVILTYPNKDNLIVRENDEVELVYDEFFDAMGDNNHNVYEGTATLVFE